MYDKKRIGVFGAGAIGGITGGLLSRAGHDVTFIDTWYEHIEKINSNGLIVKNQESEYLCKPKAIHINNLQGIKEKFDIGIIAVKSYDTEWATHALKNYVKDEGYFVDFQNGINDLKIASIVGEEKTLGCIITISAVASKPGYAWRTDNRKDVCFKIGEVSGGVTERLKDFVAMMQAVGLSGYTEDLLSERWSKLMVNCMANPLAGLTGWGTSKVRTEPITQNVAIQIASEVVKVAKSEGFKMGKIMGMEPDNFVDAANGKNIEEIKNQFLDAAKQAGSASRPSFGQDVLKKRRTEINYLTGYVSDMGKKNNISTPFCNKITEIVNDLGVGFDPSPEHIEELEKMLS
ncbi:MAG: ketopantoate reductase family protein [Chloroflexi bacterium]|nr:MAG: ketopantoate reductase family protein [Chloroflexota bacterium]